MFMRTRKGWKKENPLNPFLEEDISPFFIAITIYMVVPVYQLHPFYIIFKFHIHLSIIFDYEIYVYFYVFHSYSSKIMLQTKVWVKICQFWMSIDQGRNIGWLSPFELATMKDKCRWSQSSSRCARDKWTFQNCDNQDTPLPSSMAVNK